MCFKIVKQVIMSGIKLVQQAKDAQAWLRGGQHWMMIVIMA
jgi:hypothetical protein